MNKPPDLHCIVCNNTDPDGFRVRYKKPGFAVWQCGACGFLFIPSRYRSDVDYADYKSREVSDRVARGDVWVKKQRNLLRYDLIRKTHPSGSILDVGCGFGHFLLTGREMGYATSGVEMCRANADFVQKQFGIPVWRGDFLDFPETGTFDVITLWDTLEHMDHADKTIEKASRLLKPGGLLVVQVPQADSLLARLLGSEWWAMGPDHANYFSRTTLGTLLEKNGLSVALFRSSIELKNMLVYILIPKWMRLRGGSGVVATAGRQDVFNRMVNKPFWIKRLLILAHHAVYRTLSFLRIGDEMVVTAVKT